LSLKFIPKLAEYLAQKITISLGRVIGNKLRLSSNIINHRQIENRLGLSRFLF